MSVYNFNHQEHSSHANHNVSNGSTQVVRYQQAESDYLNRGFSSTNHLDMSRPTSKTALLVRQRRAMLEQLSCYLCKGYLIDATTIDECMDSFCRSCIVIYLRSHNNCPKCGTLIHKTNPLSTIRSDKVLQDIVYKLVPGLYDNEMKRRRDFYRGMFALSSSDDDDGDGSSSSFTGRGSNKSGEHFGVISRPKPFYKPTDSIDLSIEPQTRGDSSDIYYDNKRQSIVTCFTGNLQQQQQPPGGSVFSAVHSQQFKTYLRCPAKLTALQLKRFVAVKFNVCRADTIHLLYLNESLKDEYSLIDIAYIYDWRGIEHMRLFYIIERDLNKITNLHDSQREGETRKAKRQSVGTSTQTVKRVCIDPHPKFYEEQSSNSVNPVGRNMRSRNETPTSSSCKSIVGHLTQTPILRSYTSGRESSRLTSTIAQSSGINGHSSRELTALENSDSRRPPTSSVTSAVDELSHLRQESPKDTRSSRKLNSESASIPKVNINLNSLNRNVDPEERNNNNNYSCSNRIGSADDNNRKEVMVQQSNVRHLVPYVNKGYSPALNTTGHPQSSMVTLASFTESRSNHVVAMNNNTAARVTSSYQNMLDASGSNTKQDVKSIAKTSPMTKAPASVPQLAFSFVTERGITIVRRLNNHDEMAASTSSSTVSTKAISIPTLPGPTSQSSSLGTIGPTSSQSTSTGISHLAVATGCEGQATSMSSSVQDGTSARHNLKVKPVYKTFVDPTKLKSPNFKKLGYTARH